MSAFSDVQVAQVARGAGFIGIGLRVAIAVALAESGGDTGIVNPLGCVGLWQINQARWLSLGMSVQDLKDPVKNASAAWTISGHGVNWKPWSTYKSGKYKSFLGRADAAMKGTGSSSLEVVTAKAVSGAAEPLENSAVSRADAALANNPLNGIEQLTKVVRDAALTYLVVIVAVVLIILGVVLLARKQVAAVIPAGKALKVAKALT